MWEVFKGENFLKNFLSKILNFYHVCYKICTFGWDEESVMTSSIHQTTLSISFLLLGGFEHACQS